MQLPINYLNILLLRAKKLDLNPIQTNILIYLHLFQSNFFPTVEGCNRDFFINVMKIDSNTLENNLDILTRKKYIKIKIEPTNIFFVLDKFYDHLNQFFYQQLLNEIDLNLQQRIELAINIKLTNSDVELLDSLVQDGLTDSFILQCFINCYFANHSINHKAITAAAEDYKSSGKITNLAIHRFKALV